MKKYEIPNFNDLDVLVIGDAMIDRYFHGQINRRSPEADVPILDVQRSEDRLGGAANVAKNIKSLGADVTLFSMIGTDAESKVAIRLADKLGIQHYFLQNWERPTTVKTRLYNGQEYLMRFDNEMDFDITRKIADQFLGQLAALLEETSFDVAILQDYNKGIFTPYSIDLILGLLKERDIPIAVDPKKKNFFAFHDVALFKPNLKEVTEAFSVSAKGSDLKAVENLCVQLQEKLNCEKVLITLSENGAVGYQNELVHHQAFKRNIIDVSGAGDTVIAVAAMLLAFDADMDEICFISNLAGGLVIEETGVSTLLPEDLTKALADYEK